MRTQRLCYQVRVYRGGHHSNNIRAVHYYIKHGCCLCLSVVKINTKLTVVLSRNDCKFDCSCSVLWYPASLMPYMRPSSFPACRRNPAVRVLVAIGSGQLARSGSVYAHTGRPCRPRRGSQPSQRTGVPISLRRVPILDSTH